MVSRMNHILGEFPEGDYIPYFTNDELGQAIVPSLFGLPVVIEDIQKPYNTERLVQDLEKDLDKVPERIDPDKDGWGPRLRDRIRFFIDATDGQIPVAAADHQSPYGVATKLMGNEALMMAMYDTPDLVHELMRRATRAISDLAHAIQRWAGSPDLVVLNPATPVREGGFIIWDDYISVITPALHREFCLPYNLQLYREFGFGHLHTCGPYFPHYLDALLAHDGIRSIDICSYLGQTSHTREEMLELRRRTREKGIQLRGGLDANTIVGHMAKGVVTPADAEFLRDMAHGGLVWHAGGTREQGLTFLDWARRAVA